MSGTYVFDTLGDYKTEFNNEVTRIVSQNIESKNEKNALVMAVTDAYVRQVGQRPDIRELDDLASWVIFGTKGVSVRKKMEIKAMEMRTRREEVALNG